MREIALVTGASGGIGEDLARLIAASGRDVVLLARSAAKLQALADDLSRTHRIAASVLSADLAAPGAADQVARALGERNLIIDILVNNAGFGSVGAFANEDPNLQHQMMQVNIVALTTLTRYLLPGMIERRRGRILNIASTAAFQPGPRMAVYYATKAYVLSLSTALSEETAGTGVTVTCLCPGPTKTGFQERAKIENTRLLKFTGTMSSADVAQAGYDGMMAGRALVVPGMMNKVGVQAVRFTPRSVVTRIIKAMNAER